METRPTMTISDKCKLLGCTPAQLKAQYLLNALQLMECSRQAEKAGGKFRGWTTAKWVASANRYEQLAASIQ